MDVPEDTEQSMAQMMGFSSFGSHDHPQKKRRYNPLADASLPPRPPPTSTTGSNSLPLGATKKDASSAANADEIDLEEEDDEDGGAVTVAEAEDANSASTAGAQNSLPQRPAAPSQHQQHHQQQQPHHNRGQQRDGKSWYEGYYDSLSNENPWAKLEKSLGLEPIGGTWK